MQESIIKGFRFKILYIFCVSKDGKRVERIYEIPEIEIYDQEKDEGRTDILIVKNPLRKNSKTLYWYEKYRVTDEEELKKADKILKEILEKCE